MGEGSQPSMITGSEKDSVTSGGGGQPSMITGSEKDSVTLGGGRSALNDHWV